MLTKGISICVAVKTLNIKHHNVYSDQLLHVTVLQNKIFPKIKIVFLHATVTKMTLEEQAKHTAMLQCLTGSAEYLKAHFSDVWNTF